MLIPIVNGFRIQGAVSFENVVALRSAGEQWIKAHVATNPFVIDLSDMKDQDASSISLLLSWLRAAQKNNVSFSLLHVPQSLQRMSKMFGLDVASKSFVIYPTELKMRDFSAQIASS
jgi:anti-anti-sigma factor